MKYGKKYKYKFVKKTVQTLKVVKTKSTSFIDNKFNTRSIKEKDKTPINQIKKSLI